MLQCYKRHAFPMEHAIIRPSVTLYSLDRSLPNLVWLITSVTPTQMPILVKLVEWEIPRKYVNTSVTFCSVPFSWARLEKKPVNRFA